MKPKLVAMTAAMLVANIFMNCPANADQAAAPSEETQGNVSYVSGGVGEDEAAAMKAAAAGYPLEMQFVQHATPRDEYLANVKVKILDRSNNVMLDAVANGPFLLARLPAGSYRVEADYNGIVKRQVVNVKSGGHQRSVFVWVAADGSNGSMLNNSISENSN